MTTILHVISVRPLPSHRLWLRFSNGETRVFDLTPFLTQPAFLPLQDQEEFERVYLDYGTVCWRDGEIDFAPETMYEEGISVSDSGIA